MGNIDLLIREESVLDLELLVGPIEVIDCVLVLILPLLSDFLLVNHDLVCLLLVPLVSLLAFQKTVLKVGNLYVCLVIDLVDSAVEDNLEAVNL